MARARTASMKSCACASRAAASTAASECAPSSAPYAMFSRTERAKSGVSCARPSPIAAQVGDGERAHGAVDEQRAAATS